MLLLLGQHCRTARGRLALDAELGDITMAVWAGLLLLLQKGRLVGDISIAVGCAMAGSLTVLQGLLGCWLGACRKLFSWWSTTPSTAGNSVLPGLLLLHLLRIRSQSCI
jgi:hypothetical protein